MKYFILLIFVISISLMVCGFVLDVDYSEKLVGFGVVLLFLVGFPLFSFYRWKNKDLKDYMLTKENLEKMRESQKEKRY